MADHNITIQAEWDQLSYVTDINERVIFNNTTATPITIKENKTDVLGGNLPLAKGRSYVVIDNADSSKIVELEIVNNSTGKILNNGYIAASGNSTFQAYKKGVVDATNNSKGKGYDDSTITLLGHSYLDAYGRTMAEAYHASVVVAYEDGVKVRGFDKSDVTAYKASSVILKNAAHGIGYENAKLDLYDQSTGEGFNNSSLKGYGSSTLKLNDYTVGYGYDKSLTLAFQDSRFYGYQNSVGMIFKNAIAEAAGNCNIHCIDSTTTNATENAIVYASGKSCVDLRGNAICNASGDTNIVARDNSRVYICSVPEITIKGTYATAMKKVPVTDPVTGEYVKDPTTGLTLMYEEPTSDTMAIAPNTVCVEMQDHSILTATEGFNYITLKHNSDGIITSSSFVRSYHNATFKISGSSSLEAHHASKGTISGNVVAYVYDKVTLYVKSSTGGNIVYAYGESIIRVQSASTIYAYDKVKVYVENSKANVIVKSTDVQIIVAY